MKPKINYELAPNKYLDVFGREIKVGDFVIYSAGGRRGGKMYICYVCERTQSKTGGTKGEPRIRVRAQDTDYVGYQADYFGNNTIDPKSTVIIPKEGFPPEFVERASEGKIVAADMYTRFAAELEKAGGTFKTPVDVQEIISNNLLDLL